MASASSVRSCEKGLLLLASVTLQMEPPGFKGHSLPAQFHHLLLRQERLRGLSSDASDRDPTSFVLFLPIDFTHR